MSTTTLNLVSVMNLDNVHSRLVNTAGYAQDVADLAIEMYRKFLFLKATYPKDKIVPPKLVDDVWHEHIIFTQDYIRTCEKINGAYIHHTPLEPDCSPADMMAHDAGWTRTKELFQREFQIDLENNPITGMRMAGDSG